jgi:hypothetical protein
MLAHDREEARHRKKVMAQTTVAATEMVRGADSGRVLKGEPTWSGMVCERQRELRKTPRLLA